MSAPTPAEVGEVLDRLEDNIGERGWDATVDGAAKALAWVLGIAPLHLEATIRTSLELPAADRRRIWLAHGGNPDDWPEGT